MATGSQSQPDVIMSQANMRLDVDLSLVANDLNHFINTGESITVTRQRVLGENVPSGKAYSNESA